jgi:hypothetical protein
MLSSRLLIGCAAVGALVLAPATSAVAAGHTHAGKGQSSRHGSTHGRPGTDHGTGHAAGHGNGHGKGHGSDRGSRDRLAGPRGAAGHVLKAQAARLTRLLAAVGAGDSLTVDDQAALVAALQSDLDALTADLAAIPQATDVHQLNAIKHAAVLTVTIGCRQVAVTVEAGALKAQLADRAATLSDLDVQVAIAVDMGQPVPGAEAALEDAHAQLALADADAQDAVDGILALSPTASRADLQAASDAASQALLDAGNALAAVDADIITIDTALGL